MYCRKCIKSKKEVNMTVSHKEQKYTCPKCKHHVKWDSKNSLN